MMIMMMMLMMMIIVIVIIIIIILIVIKSNNNSKTHGVNFIVKSTIEFCPIKFGIVEQKNTLTFYNNLLSFYFICVLLFLFIGTEMCH